MKNKLFLMAALSLFLMLGIFVSCDDSSGDSGGAANAASRGVLGQVAGVVYDGVTAKPLTGVEVRITGYASVKTSGSGEFLIRDVKPGTHEIIFKKDGYVYAHKSVTVDKDQYKNDDPFAEYEVLRTEFALFNEWISKPNLPGFSGVSGTNENWTYSDGVYFNANGEGVTYNEAEKTFVFSDKKLDYTYRTHVPVGLFKMVPLTGKLKAKINLVFTAYNATPLTTPVDKVESIKDGVPVYLKTTNAAGNNGINETIYGPFMTANGGVEAEKLPANTTFMLALSDGFTQPYNNVDYYFNDAAFYISNGLGTLQAATFATDLADTVDVGTLYLFTFGDVAYALSSNVANAATPLPVTQSITITFSKPIDTDNFIASIKNITNTTAALSSGTELSLKAAWNATKDTVTLTPNVLFIDYSALKLPYSIDETAKVGDLSISGKALDGSTIFTGALPVYTEGMVKLVAVEAVSASASPARAAYVVEKGGTIKMSFNKLVTVLPSASFMIANTPAYYKIDGKNIYVWNDAIVSGGVSLSYPDIYSGADTSDKSASGTISNIYSKEMRKLVLIGTNLYRSIPINAADNSFPITGDIELTFGSAIPSGTTAEVALYNGGTLIATSTTLSGNKITIDPSNNLTPLITYGITVKLIDSTGVLLWETPTASNNLVEIVGNRISFSTSN
ncbi:MAG: Ig-like domain-containing protein [Treponema sp.]|jgi:hypothetical protein|nr:Ig-like domain-containing protein [Treponema sp.]